MKHLLNLLAAVALLVWGTYLVRTGILRVFGANLRHVLARSIGTRPAAAMAGLGVTALVQSSTATALIVSAFVGQGIVTLPTALAVMLGADVGTSLMTVVFSLDLSWLSPLFIFVGVVLFITRQTSPIGRFGRVLIGLGLMLLALRLVSETTGIMVKAPAVKALLQTLSSDILLEITVGAVMSVIAYSSLAIVLLTATLAASGAIPLDVALGLTLGANLGSGLLGVLATAKSTVEVRQVPIGNLVFKCVGVLIAAPFVPFWIRTLKPYLPEPATVVVLYHLVFNALIALLFLAFTHVVARWVEQWLPKQDKTIVAGRPHHLDPSALSTPSLAISNAAREALHQADVVETMLLGTLRVIKD
ncbi:MAG TPA: Na/Pi symporter, partial [Ramlibacter sp.]|nr:Na/Pi symporter [Ramlibacter sp.]